MEKMETTFWGLGVISSRNRGLRIMEKKMESTIWGLGVICVRRGDIIGDVGIMV